MVKVEVQYAVTDPNIPTQQDFQHWASVIEAKFNEREDVAIRIVDEGEITNLNNDYRNRAQATNVLAFPTEIPKGTGLPFIGDIVICAPIVAKQAAEQGKSLSSHWAHLTLHGILHLQGYDHIDSADARIMEQLEAHLMQKLGFPNPYL